MNKTVARHINWMEMAQKRLPEIKVGQTPKDIIWRRNKAQLYRYKSPLPDGPKHRTPILMIYALINRHYILDLAPGKSLVEYLVNEGFDVYLIDWGYAGPEDAHQDFSYYVIDLLPQAVEKVLRTSGVKEVSLLGYCMGGTLTAIYGALYPRGIKNTVFLTTPIDFSHAGLYTNWLDPRYFHVDKMVDAMGNIPGNVIDLGNRMLKPIQNYLSSHVSLYDRLWDEKAVYSYRLMDKWLNDGTDFPAEAFRQWIKEFYQQNKLVKGELTLRGSRVDLKVISWPVLNVSASQDHIVPVAMAEALKRHVSSTDYEYVVYSAGHVGMVVGGGSKHLYPKISSWLADRS